MRSINKLKVTHSTLGGGMSGAFNYQQVSVKNIALKKLPELPNFHYFRGFLREKI